MGFLRLPEVGVTRDPGPVGRAAWAAGGLALVAGIGLADSLTGYEYLFSIFYVAPIALVTWYGGRGLGGAVALASAVASFVADVPTGRLYAPMPAYYWNVGMAFGFFLIVTLLLAGLKDALRRETELAHTDYLTGAVNTRFFLGVLELDMARAQRSGEPFTVAYIDVDDFKAVNDRFGHRTGDRVLRGVVEALRQSLRKTDVIARVGGDEFAVLLPATGAEAAAILIPVIERELREAMRAHGWPVTVSIGALTCVSPPPTADELMKAVDGLMYSVKKGGKNGVSHAVYPG
jgi:diguanylate cyclase (GGDEF)-like protein